MDRLTKRFDGVVYGAEGESADSLTGRWYREEFECEALIEKLAEYEDAEENGLLLRLPCKTHDYLYAPGEIGISIFKVIEFEYSAFDFFVTWKVISDCLAGFEASGTFVRDIGKTVFLTMEEAEKALEEKKSKQGED